MYCSIFILCVFGNHVFKREYYKESLSARLSLRLASTPPNLPQQSDRNHLQDALVLRLRTQFDHENTPTATAAQLTLPSTNHLNTFTLFTRTNKVLHVSSTSENAPWCNMSTEQSLIELQDKVARQNTHTLKAPSTQQFHCAKSPRDCKKTKHKSALQPESPGRSSTERKRAMTCKTLKHESKKTTLVEITLTQWLSHCEQQVDHENAPATPWCSIFTTQRLTELQENMKRRDVEGVWAWDAVKFRWHEVEMLWSLDDMKLRCCEV